MRTVAVRELADCARNCSRLYTLLDRSAHQRHPGPDVEIFRARDRVEIIRYVVSNVNEAATWWRTVLAAFNEAEGILRSVDDPEIVHAVGQLRRSLVSFAKICKIQVGQMQQVKVSHRTRFATGLALRLLPPEARTRYREEFAAELADLPRSDHARYAARQAFRALETRRSLKASPRSRTTSVVVVVTGAAGTAACVSEIGWPAVVLGCAVIAATMWAINSQERTRRLASLMRAARSDPARK